MSSTVTIALRDDDICYWTPAWVVEALRERLWMDRIVTYGAVPEASRDCFRREIPLSRTVERRPFEECSGLVKQLGIYRDAMLAEIALHGLTHEDKMVAGVRTAELDATDRSIEAKVIKRIRKWRVLFGTNTLVPPHNVMCESLRRTCLEHKITVCRSLTTAEVAAIAGSDDRAVAKALRPCWLARGGGVELYQTYLLSKARVVNSGLSPHEIADDISWIVMRSGIGVLTVHWWDFVNCDGTIDDGFVEYVNKLLARITEMVSPRFVSLSDLAELCRGRKGLTSAVSI